MPKPTCCEWWRYCTPIAINVIGYVETIFDEEEHTTRDQSRTFKLRKFLLNNTMDDDFHLHVPNIKNITIIEGSTMDLEDLMKGNLSVTTTWRMLSKEKQPYKKNKCRRLKPRHFLPRLTFCQWGLNQLLPPCARAHAPCRLCI
ncbi:unnamed protein product [Trichogramma brassicae]|uniref:Uncharacterized protein n=1 Tax=Trichogramma brassicae TaxID=86971 RepID=A0A6H5HRV0_9HYME|nr:unnamed protein product [Trichogramma brassicae]